jgi:hypothetical protein
LKTDVLTKKLEAKQITIDSQDNNLRKIKDELDIIDDKLFAEHGIVSEKKAKEMYNDAQ